LSAAATPSGYEISTERERFDVDRIHGFLSSTYWARGVPRSVIETSIQNSLCFGAFLGGEQVGFARVITDRATFGYIADVFVLPEHRGRGVAKLLIRAILGHPELQGLRRFLLATRDAHRLYAQFGFQPLPNPEDFMTIHDPNPYGRESSSGETRADASANQE
jgi:GNAT superfamily N-acetyltransferase